MYTFGLLNVSIARSSFYSFSSSYRFYSAIRVLLNEIGIRSSISFVTLAASRKSARVAKRSYSLISLVPGGNLAISSSISF